MIKWLIGFALAVVLAGLMLDTFAQGPIIVYDPEGNVKSMIVLPLPPPQWR